MMHNNFTPHIDFTRPKRKRGQIGIIPLIDIAFFLLIFFMVAGSIESFDVVDVELPQAQTGEIAEVSEVMIILGAHDEMILDDLQLTPTELHDRLKARLSLNPNQEVVIKADASVPAIRVINVMDAVQLAGGKKVTMATIGAGDGV